MSTPQPQIIRCAWAKNSHLIRYHDEEWGIPVHDDRKLFEFLILESAQAGLSWDIILRRRENYRAAFHCFDAAAVARYTAQDASRLIEDAGIVRNRLKIAAAIGNAKAFLEIQNEFGSFGEYIWKFTGGHPRINSWRDSTEIPVTTTESDTVSRELKKRGFRFVGSTICYAFMQATGIVDDHTLDCFRRSPVKQ